MSPLEEEQVNVSQNRAYIFVGNVSEFVCRKDWTAAEKAAREAIHELQMLVATIAAAADRTK